MHDESEPPEPQPGPSQPPPRPPRGPGASAACGDEGDSFRPQRKKDTVRIALPPRVISETTVVRSGRPALARADWRWLHGLAFVALTGAAAVVPGFRNWPWVWLVFGCGHLHGYPPGPLGAVLAGLYGLGLGWLRVFSGGLGWPVVARVVADATLFTLVARSAGG